MSTENTTDNAPPQAEAQPVNVPQHVPEDAGGQGLPPAPQPAPDPAAELAAQQEQVLKRKQALAEQAEKAREARRHLVESVARRWEFQWMDAKIGHDPEAYPGFLDMAAEDYREGRFFLEEISLFYLVSPQLSLTIFELRQAWIRQYDIKTVPEYMLLDQAMLAYFHVIRVNKEIANMFALIDESLFYPDEPLVRVYAHGKERGWKMDHFNAKEHLMKLQDSLLPLMERFNQMFLRNLRALRELKGSPVSITIGQAGQVNLGQQQVNVAGGGHQG